MAGNSTHSIQRDGPSTNKRAKKALSAQEQLSIFEQECVEITEAGFVVQVANHWTPEMKTLVIHIIGAQWCAQCHHMKPIEEMIQPGLCLACANDPDSPLNKVIPATIHLPT
jgi:hypothetical protein